jgi:hypothetical protein
MDGRMDAVEVLGSRILLHPSELERSHRFYRDQLGLAIYREFGSRDAPPVPAVWKSAESETHNRHRARFPRDRLVSRHPRPSPPTPQR